MLLQQIILLLTTHKYLFLFPVAVVEGPIITVIAGFLSSLGLLNIFIAYAVVVVGDIVGDIMHYAFGYYGRQKFVKRWGRFLGITLERVEQLEKHFEKHTGKTLIIGKLSQVVGAVVLVAAGIARVPLRKFIWYNFISTLPKSLILLLIGYYSGESYVKISSYLDYTAIGTVVAAVIFIVIYFMIKNVSKKYVDKNTN
ncbi:MAG: VTT domain-containing protein [Dehalococcoidia bacterium]